jgi:hypothetical protein
MQWIRAQASVEHLRVTQHAQQEMAEEDIILDDVLDAIGAGEVLGIIRTISAGRVVLSTVSRVRTVHSISFAHRVVNI